MRLAAIATVGFETLRFGDARAYLFAAKELVRTGRYPLATEPFYFRAPGYPVFLVAATLGHPDRIALAKIANAALGALAAVLLAGLSAWIFRRRGVALATGVVAAIHPGFVFLSTDIQSEPLFLVLLLSAGWLLLASADRPSSNLALLGGAALALAALTRPSALALTPLLAAQLADRRYPLRARGHLAASALLGFVGALAPWTLRNAIVYRELVPVNDAGGSAFYQGNSNWMVRFYQLKSLEEYKNWSAEAFADLDRQTRAIEAAAPLSPSAKSRYFVRKTFEERRGDPAGWAKVLLRKTWDWLRSYPNPLFWPTWVVWSVGAFYTVLTLLAAVGLVTGPRPGVRCFSLVFLAVTMAAHVALIVVWRYRIPYWDPVLLLYAVPGAMWLAKGAPRQNYAQAERPLEDTGGILARPSAPSSLRCSRGGFSVSSSSRGFSRSEAPSEPSTTSIVIGRSRLRSGLAPATVWAPPDLPLSTGHRHTSPFWSSARRWTRSIATSGCSYCRVFWGDAPSCSRSAQPRRGAWRVAELCSRGGSSPYGPSPCGRQRSRSRKTCSSRSFPPLCWCSRRPAEAFDG